jgi:predicted DNA-binding transcriptional regulator AlpA
MRNVIHNFKDVSQQARNHSSCEPALPTIAPLLSLEQVAEWLGTSKAWVRDHATRRCQRIPVVRLGGRRALLRFRPEDVERFINSNLQPAEEAPQ